MCTFPVPEFPWTFLAKGYVAAAVRAPGGGPLRAGRALEPLPHSSGGLFLACFGLGAGMCGRATFGRLQELVYAGKRFRAVANAVEKWARLRPRSAGEGPEFALMDLDYRCHCVSLASYGACVVFATKDGGLIPIACSDRQGLSIKTVRMKPGDEILTYTKRFDDVCRVRELVQVVTPAALADPSSLQKRIASKVRTPDGVAPRPGSLFMLGRDGHAVRPVPNGYAASECHCFRVGAEVRRTRSVSSIRELPR